MCERCPWVTDLFLEDYKVAVLQQTLISDHCVEEGKKGGKDVIREPNITAYMLIQQQT